MSIAILAKKAYAQKGLSRGGEFRTGPKTVNVSSRIAQYVEYAPDVWKPVQDQSQSTYLHKKIVNYASCWPAQNPDVPADCSNKCNARNIYKDMRISSSSDYISVFQTNKTCYSQEQVPRNNTC